MKKFEEEMKELFGGPLGFSIKFQNGYEAYSLLIKHFKGWVSPEEHQYVVEKLEALEDEFEVLKLQLNDSAEELERLDVLEKENESLKSQLEKQQPEIPEVPQSVADFIVGHKFNHYKMVEDFEKMSNDSEIKRWIFDNISTNAHGTDRGLKTLFELINHGYTVAKDKLFYLKNKLTGGYIAQDCYNGTRETYNCYDRTAFTQQEIDNMDTGSYEQIEVEG